MKNLLNVFGSVLVAGLALHGSAALADHRIDLSSGQSVTLQPSDVTETTQISCGARPDATACANYTAQRSGTFSSDVLLRLRAACRSNYGDACIRYTAERSGTFSAESLIALSTACANNQNTDCVAYVSERSGAFGATTVGSLAQACQYNHNADCVRSLADRSGTFGANKLGEFAQSCADQ